jgi:hypothetical protein
MIRIPRLLLFLFFLLQACGHDNRSASRSENDIDAARNFIRAALDGKFDLARTFLLPDSVNTNWMDVAERSYEKADADTKNGYRSSSIIIHRVSPVNDSTTVIIYSNSFKNDHDTLRIMKQHGQWLVDLKYLYEHDMDTLPAKKIFNDSLR